jgi:hypothetical protein
LLTTSIIPLTGQEHASVTCDIPAIARAQLAVDFLTSYSCAKATEALEMAKRMTAKLHTIISHFNAPL